MVHLSINDRRETVMVKCRFVRVSLVALALGACGVLGLGASTALAGLDGYSQWIETDRVSNANGAEAHGKAAPQTAKEMTEEELRAEITELWGEDAGKKMHKAKPLMVPYKAKTWATMITEPSSNWAGYKSKAYGVSGATGCIVAKRCYNGDSGAFVGITDDYDELIQAGVDMQTMTAFVECLPATAQTVFRVSQNDRIYVSVRPVGTVLWKVVIYDSTNGMSYGIIYGYSGPEKYACWILETQHYQHAGTWGTVNFSNCNWVSSAGSGYGISAGSGYYYKKIMTTYFGERVEPSGISGGTAFSVTR